LFVISSFFIIAVSFLTQKSEGTKMNKVKYLLADSFSEIKININNLGAVSGYKTNLILSAFIVIIIIGLWSIWY